LISRKGFTVETRHEQPARSVTFREYQMSARAAALDAISAHPRFRDSRPAEIALEDHG
jgi:hypothetical protein